MGRTLRPGRTALSCAVLLGLTLPGSAGAQARRALIIGINDYPHFTSDSALARIGRAHVPPLEGSVNDAMAMRDLLTARFGFERAHIALLLDTAATRAAIVAAIRRLTAEAQPGDVVFFFYAGHGSQRYNSLTARPTKLDQTIVPADANEGVFDIRDKELARLFDALIDKHVILTLIFDSCHSGAITRGIPVAYRERWAAMDPRDAADPSAPKPPEDQGALVMSSAQDYQTAGETKDESGTPHGVFSSALLTVLRTAPPEEPASRVFQRVKAMMQSSGRPQEPVLAGNAQRLSQPIFGSGGAGGTAGTTTVALLRAGAPGEVELQGGTALGLRENTELVRFGRASSDRTRLRITKVSGLSRSTAQVIAGERDSLRPGDLFAVDKWAAPPAAGLRVWLPAALDGPSRARLVTALAPLRTAPGIEWIEDPSALAVDSTPLAIVQWQGNGWTVESSGKLLARIPGPLTATSVQNALRGQPKKVRLFVYLPPSSELIAHLELGNGTHNDLVEIVSSRADADYLLVGRLHEAGMQYAWMRPNASADMALKATLPSRTTWVIDSGAPATLVEQALRLAKVRSWLEMTGPPGDNRFPYRLALRNATTGALKTAGPVYDGEWYGLVLRADSAQITPSLEPRRVYVFGIDTDGNGVLLFPVSNVLNRVPYAPTENGSWPTEIRLGQDSLFPIVTPFGLDTYILLTSDEVVPTEALAWEGVRSRGPEGGSPLSTLLFSASSATRAPTPPVPVTWSIQHLPVLSAPKP
jgi:caspase domain-containing protein